MEFFAIDFWSYYALIRQLEVKIMMKKAPKEITGFSAASIVGLRAAIASEKTRVQSGSPAPRPVKSSQVSNKGTIVMLDKWT